MEKIYSELEALIVPLSEEQIRIEESSGRVPVKDLLAPRDYPAADEALRDGYALGGASRIPESYQVVGEVPAGCIEAGIVAPGEAKRIFTGATVPDNTVRVVPFEELREQENTIQVPQTVLQQKNIFIRRRGQDIQQGECLVPAGRELTADLVEKLAVAGVFQLTTHRSPQVLVCCTGSELVTTGDEAGSGQKVSSNGLLLSHLLPNYGARLAGVLTRADNLTALTDFFLSCQHVDSQVVITTGGLGPGKYDLVERAFVQAGGEVWLRALPMRPGKAILLGILAGRLIIGLPGPPTAVRTLTTELVGPALLLLQGVKHFRPTSFTASYAGPAQTFRGDLTLVKSGRLLFEHGRCLVTDLGSSRDCNCNVLIPGRIKALHDGDLVEVHPWREFLRMH